MKEGSGTSVKGKITFKQVEKRGNIARMASGVAIP
jgi:hypothetical protein